MANDSAGRSTVSQAIIAIGAVVVACSGAASAKEHRDPVVDLSKNPGCGLKLTNKEEKTARNIRIAEYSFAAYREAGLGDELKHGLSEYRCMDDATIVGGVFEPPPSENWIRPSAEKRLSPQEADKLWKEGNTGAHQEVRRLKQIAPDWGAVPGTFRVIAAWEDGITWVYSLGGARTPGGELIMKNGQRVPPIWEVTTYLFNEEGFITRVEWWDDSMAVDAQYKASLGVGLREMGGFQGYLKALHDHDAKLKNPK